MSFLVMGIILVLLNFSVSKLAGSDRNKWLISGAATMIVLSPIVYMLTLNIIGNYSGDGIGASFAGLVFAAITLINGLVFIFIGLYSKNSKLIISIRKCLSKGTFFIRSPLIETLISETRAIPKNPAVENLKAACLFNSCSPILFVRKSLPLRMFLCFRTLNSFPQSKKHKVFLKKGSVKD